MRRLAVLAISLIACSSALAQPRPGFERNPQLTVRASRVAGVTSRVYCARDVGSWAAFVNQSGFGPLGAEIFAMTEIADRETFLAPRICTPIRNWLGGRPMPLAPLADAVFTFTHEAAHLKGITGECAADRWAFARLERVARAEFGIRKPARLRELVRLARERSGYIETC
jgi:hypothetical protein